MNFGSFFFPFDSRVVHINDDSACTTVGKRCINVVIDNVLEALTSE